MQIGKTDMTGAGATLRTSQADASQASTQPCVNANPKGSGVAAPLSGGSRTLSPGIFTKAQDSEAPSLTPATLADMVAERAKAFSKTLAEAFKAANIPTDQPIAPHVDGAGRVTAEGPYKERINKLFQERPDLEKEFKDIAALNAIVALNGAMRHFSQARKDTRDEDERSRAEATYLSNCLEIQSRSNTMVMVEGQLVSSAIADMAQR